MKPGARHNRIYLGEIEHKGEIYPGDHDAIVDRELFEAVQAKLKANRNSHVRKAKLPSLLTGKLYDVEGNRLYPCHANKGGKRYRYYISKSVMNGGESKTRARWPAESLESFVRAALSNRIRAPTIWLADPMELTLSLHDAAVHLANRIADEGIGASTLQSILSSAVLQDDQCALALDAEMLRFELKLQEDTGIQDSWTVPLTIRTCHNGRKRTLGADSAHVSDNNLVTALVRAHQWHWALLDGQHKSINAIAEEVEGDARYVKRLLTLVYLAPDLKQAILEGQQPPDMSIQTLNRKERLQAAFGEQRQRWNIDGSA